MSRYFQTIKWMTVKWAWAVPMVATVLQACSVPTDRLGAAIQAQLSGQWPAIEVNRIPLNKYYQRRDYRPVWIDEHGPLPRATSLLTTLLAADAHGLDPYCYDVQTIKQLWSVKMIPALAKLELLLTHAFIKYSDDVRNGLLQPGARSPNWRADGHRLSALPLLDELLSSREFADELQIIPPPQTGYQALRGALQYYRQLARQGGWQAIPAGPSLRLGQRHPQVRLLRARLLVEDKKLLGAKDDSRFDRPLHAAVQRFQQRHGLEAQGLVGPATRQAMNVPIETRIQQLQVNMDRWRWLPRELGDDYIMVNTADYRLTAYVDHDPHMAMRVITGKPARPTPFVGGTLVQVVINPDWVVPNTIITKDIIPMMRDDPDYLRKKKIRVFTGPQADATEVDPASIDWAGIDRGAFPYTLVQDPGADNSLGRIKFIFLNDFAVFLHDTPIRELFDQNKRAFSSGCIRVENPKQLAMFLLGEDSGWDDDELEKSIEEGYTEKLQMERPIPVYLVYWTAWVDGGEGVNFRDDIYKWDQIQGKCA